MPQPNEERARGTLFLRRSPLPPTNPKARGETIVEAIAAGLAVHAESRNRGYADAAAGIGWQPAGCDTFSYALGYQTGTLERGLGGEGAT